MSAANRLPDWFLVCTIARLLAGRKHVAVGANSPIPGSAALLAVALSEGRTKASILGSHRYSCFTGLGDLFDCAGRGDLDAFFLSPGQIDGQANINMVGIGTYPNFDMRWPGSHGSPLLYMTIPNIILFKPEHSLRSLVPKVDFITAPGTSPPNVHRPGGPGHLVTGKAIFAFDRNRTRFRLESFHPGYDVEEIRKDTGFEFDIAPDARATPEPPPEILTLLREQVVPQIGELYPRFAATLMNETESGSLSA
jgi:glutaconate CoA-transferase, subunit B